MKPSTSCLAASFVALALPAAVAQTFSTAAPRVLVLDQTAGGPWDAHSPADVDDRGRVVGQAVINGMTEGYEWTASGGFNQIPTLYSGVGRINSNGDMIHTPHNPLELADGTLIWIPNLMGTLDAVRLYDVNDRLTVVGRVLGSGTTSNILVWDPIGGSRNIFVPTAISLDRVNQGSLAVGNRIVQTTGRDGFVVDIETGEATLFNSILPPGPTTWSIAVDVSNKGVVVGEGSDGVGLSAFTWTAASGFTFLPGLKGGETLRVHPRAIDDRGRVVGQALTAANEWRAFLWDPQSGMHDLNDLVAAPTGYVMHEARDIADETGVVIGWGTLHGNVLPQRGFVIPSL